MIKNFIFLFFLFGMWILGFWVFDLISKDYVCYVVFPNSNGLEKCREMFSSVNILMDASLLERVREADSGVFVLRLFFYFIMIVLSLAILYFIKWRYKK